MSLFPLTPLLAQADPQAVSPLVSFFPIVLIAVLAYFVFVVPQRAKDQRFQKMISELKEHDRVVTTGGLQGTVTSVQRDDTHHHKNRVTLRIDDASGAKVRVALWAIDSVISEET